MSLFYQTLRIFKFTSALLLVAALQGSAKNIHSQRVTLSERDAPLSKVFKKIQQQTEYLFLYQPYLIEKKNVTISVKDVTIEEAMEKCLEGFALAFKVYDKSIIIQPKDFQVVEKTLAPPALIEVSGRVTDKEGNPLFKANVKVKGTDNGTNTNEQGEFKLKEVDENAMLEISYVGYEPEIVAVKYNKVFSVSLSVAVGNLDETIVKGYYNSTKKLNTGSVSKLRYQDIQRQTVSNPLAALQGRIAGLYIIQNSGLPGSAYSVRLRGRNSIANGTDPLYVVDGVPFPSGRMGNSNISNIIQGSSPLENINPDNIESIEVLKDADATAIYGSRGANGVILITTKKGNTGKLKVDFKINHGLGKINHKLNLLNTKQYLEMRLEAINNDGYQSLLVPQFATYFPDVMIWDTTRYTDWQSTLLGGTAHNNDSYISMTGGNSTTQFLFFGGYRRQTTVYPGDFSDKKYSGNLSISHLSENKRFSLNLAIAYLHDDNNLLKGDLTSVALTLPPDAPKVYDSNGNLNWEGSTWINPFAQLFQKFNSTSDNILINSLISYQITKGLQIKVSLGYNKIQLNEISITPKKSMDPTNTSLAFNNISNNRLATWIIEPQISYKNYFKKHQFDILIGTTFQQTKNDGQILTGSNYTSDALLESLAAAGNVKSDGDLYSKYRYTAIFARLFYTYAKKYMLNVTARRDGSGRFGPEKQFANFGAIGAAWNFTNERLFRNKNNFFSYGKLRGSYGITGSDQVSDYGFLDLWKPTSNPYQSSPGLSPTKLYNPDFGWEQTKKIEVALESGFLDDRVLININWYRNYSSRQLIPLPLATLTGFSSLQFYNQKAKILNTGWEFEITTTNIKGKNFTWNSNFNLTIPQNKLLEYPNIETSPYANIYTIGKSLSTQKAFHFIGVDPQTGIYIYQDVNGNGYSFDIPADLQSLRKISQSFFGGIQNTVTYKNLTLDFFVQFVKQTGRDYNSYFYLPGTISNQPVVVLNRWRKPGDNVLIQKFSVDVATPAGTAFDKGFYNGDVSIVDASFIRLKNVYISLNFPPKIIKKLAFSNLKLFIQAQNLFTITSYNGLNPESQAFVLPPLKTISAGIHITL